jgi:hypothetical protein
VLARLLGVVGPVTAGKVGDGDEGFPHVGLAVLDGEVRFGVAELFVVRRHPVGESVPQVVQYGERTLATELGDAFAGRTAAHRRDNTAVLDRVRQVTDPAEECHSERGALVTLT